MDVIIRNGTVVTAAESYIADVGIKDGKIAAVGAGLEDPGARIVEAKGLLVLPGAIDAHTHLAMPFGGTVSADDYRSGTTAALCGGVTTVIDYAIQRTGAGIIETVEKRRALAEEQACADFAFHCAVTDLNGGAVLEEFRKAVEYGVTSLKCFMVYKKEGMMVDDGTLAKVLLKAKETGMLVNIHAENPDLIDLRVAQFLAEGKTSPWHHYLSRPEFVEAEADIRAIHLAKNLGTPLYIVHLANEEGAAAVTKARDEGYDIIAETCPQYLQFTSDVYKREDGRNFVCSPPIKGEESRNALWDALRRGDISVVATDHCPFQSFEKDWGKDDFTKIPNGCGGIEQMYPYMLSAAGEGKITYEKAVEVCAANPARLFGCTGKGSIAVGKDADIVLYDPALDYTVTAAASNSNCDHTIWEGTKLTGYPVQTWLRGNLVYDRGEFLGKPGDGRFIRRALRK